MEAGFYKVEEQNLHHAPNAVYNKDYTLVKEEKDNYTYPNNGWSWFNTREEALASFGLTEDEEGNIIW